MMAHARFEIDDPDSVEMTMTITMTLAKWKELRHAIQELEGRYHAPHQKLARWIVELTHEAEKHFAGSAGGGE